MPANRLLQPITLGALNAIAKKDWASVIKTDEEGRRILVALETATQSAPEDIGAVAKEVFEELLSNQLQQDGVVVYQSALSDGEGDGEGEEGEGEEGEGNEEEDSEDQEQEQPQEAGKFDLEEFIVSTAKRRRDEILEGMEFGTGNGTFHSFTAPNVPEAITTERVHAAFHLLLKASSLRRPVMAVGPAGSGKTTAGMQLAKALDVPFYANSNSEWDTRTLPFGYMDGHGTYRAGYLYEPMKNGGVLLDDEVDASNRSVMISKNSAIENRFAQFPNGELVQAHADFVYVGSANTYGRGADRLYVGRTHLDAASLNRFIFIDWDYDEELELAISCNEKWTRWVQKVRKVVFEHKMRYVVSPRQSILGGELLALDIPERTVRNMVVFPGWAQADVDRVMREVM